VENCSLELLRDCAETRGKKGMISRTGSPVVPQAQLKDESRQRWSRR